MAIQVKLSLREDLPANDEHLSQPGAIAQTDGSTLCGLAIDQNPPYTAWYQTSNQGVSWTRRTDTPGAQHGGRVRGANCPDGVTVYGSAPVPFDSVEVKRSVNGGQSWTTQASFTAVPGPPFRNVLVSAAISYERSKFFMFGQFGVSPSGPFLQALRSVDAGITWTTLGVIWDAVNNSIGLSLVNVGGGLFIGGGKGPNTTSYFGRVKLSGDFGASWSNSGSMPLPGSCIFHQVDCLTAVTPEVIMAGGAWVNNPHDNGPPLWRSENSGSTWSRLTSGDVAEWNVPSGELGSIPEIKRLTRDLVVLGLKNYDDGLLPWRFSDDGGESFAIVPSVESGSVPGRCTGDGAVVHCGGGRLAMALEYDNGGGDRGGQIWTGRIVC